MTVINGAPLGTGSFNWSDTFIDRNAALPVDTEITSLGIYLTTANSVALKIAQEHSASSMTIVLSETLAHPGGGWADLTLSQPYTVPSSGTYRMGVYVNGNTDGSVSANRASAAGNITGSGSFHPMTAPLPVLRATSDGSTPPPPPPPPSGGNNYIYLFAGQSNCNNMASNVGSVFTDRMAQLVPNTTHQIVNVADASSYIAPPSSGKRHWQPIPSDGLGTLCQSAVAARDAALPASILAGVIWYQGEAQTRAGREENILNYPAYLRTTLAEISFPEVPTLIVELHEQPDSSYPLWPHMQHMQRQMTSDPFNRVENSYLVSAADLNDSTDDGLHLTNGELSILATRLADKMASLIWPR